MEGVLLPLLGGILIGLSSSTMLGGIGRITGISGIASSLLTKPSTEDSWRYAFILGLLSGGTILLLTKPELFSYSLDFPLGRTIVAGLLVGYGTRLGGGCTSGHGVCGMARLAKRSIVATLIFIFFGIISVSLFGRI